MRYGCCEAVFIPNEVRVTPVAKIKRRAVFTGSFLSESSLSRYCAVRILLQKKHHIAITSNGLSLALPVSACPESGVVGKQ